MKIIYAVCFLFIGLQMGCAQSLNLVKEVESYRAKHISEMVDYKRPPIIAEQAEDLEYYSIQESWVIMADLIRLEKERQFPMKTSNGRIKYFSAHSKARFTIDGQQQELFLFQRTDATGRILDAEHYFLPFTDTSSGVETYGGGRYMDINTNAAADGKIRLNFNVAYNPWCAYGGLYACPIPPKENNLDIKIEAGEKIFHSK